MANELSGLSGVRVDIVTSDYPGSAQVIGRVRKLLINDKGFVTKKFGLSFRTGEWVQIDELEPYPDECYTAISEIKRTQL